MLNKYFKTKYLNFSFSKNKESTYLKMNTKSTPCDKTRQFQIFCSFNKKNSRITLVDSSGCVLLTCTAGNLGYKKSKRSDPFVAAQLFAKCSEYLQKYNVKHFSLSLKGYNKARRPIIRLFNSSLLRNNCVEILDVSKTAYNGCRLRAKRRL
jgi:small subunit ribosomal protein S11